MDMEKLNSTGSEEGIPTDPFEHVSVNTFPIVIKWRDFVY
jgi:hypothetical protein